MGSNPILLFYTPNKNITLRKIDFLDSIDWEDSEVHTMDFDIADLSVIEDLADDVESDAGDEKGDIEEDFDELEFSRKINVNVPSGSAKAAPPIGPTLSQFGVDVKEFCTVFNELTTPDLVHDEVELRVVIYLFKDLSLLFFIKSPCLFYLIQLSLQSKREEGFDLLALRMARQSLVARRRFFRSRVAISALVLYKIFLVKYMFDCYNYLPQSILSSILSTLYGTRCFIYIK